jgi:hypothetical protein
MLFKNVSPDMICNGFNVAFSRTKKESGNVQKQIKKTYG